MKRGEVAMIPRERFTQEVQKIVEQLIRKYTPEKIILFGSLARETAEPRDIDLFIIKKAPPYSGAERIRELDKLITYHIATDFLVYTPEEVEKRLKLGDPFIKTIFTEGKVLYERK
jgi:predicted nucleotidyltransferase